MNWEVFRVFNAVLATGGYSSASAELGLSIGTVRRYVDRLEDRLGSPLFTHAPEGVTPTAAALALAPTVQRVAGAASAFARLATGSVDSLKGRVRIAAEPLMARVFLPPLWSRLQAAHPGLEFELTAAVAEADPAWGEADIAVRTTDVGGLAMASSERTDPAAGLGPDVQGRWAARFTVGFFAHRAFIAEHGAPNSVSELMAAPLVGPYPDGVLAMAFGSECPGMDCNIVFSANGRAARIAAIRAGVGIGLIPVFLARREPDLIRVVPEAGVIFDACVVIRRDMADVRRIALVRDALAEHLAGLER